MEWGFVWKSLLLVTVGFVLLRFSGRKSIAQMTIPTTVVMISIGSIIIQPIVETSVWRTIGAATIFIGMLVLVEYLQVKSNFVEGLFTGRALSVIENGQMVPKNMRKLRMTVDKLEMQLRQKGISNVTDVKTATVEGNGQIGYELMEDQKPLTVGEFKRLMAAYLQQLPQGQTQAQPGQQAQPFNLFDEVVHQKHDKFIDPKLQ